MDASILFIRLAFALNNYFFTCIQVKQMTN